MYATFALVFCFYDEPVRNYYGVVKINIDSIILLPFSRKLVVVRVS